MPYYSKSSKEKLETCHQDLQTIFNYVIQIYDNTIVCGNRGEQEQNEAYDKGFSKLRYPKSKHNIKPSRAVDAVPYPIDWKDEKRFHELAGVVKATAFMLKKYGAINSEIEWGGDWKNFKDLPHYQLKTKI